MVSHRFSVPLLLFVFASLYMLLSHSTIFQLWKRSKTSSNTDKSELSTNSLIEIDGNEPIVTIPSLGKVIGSFSSSSNGRNYSAFRGIPYAKPPIGELRFKDPEPVEPWEVLNATKYGFWCPQLSGAPSEEDCLTLNIFTHDANPVKSKPVLVFIHGGSFVAGSGSRYRPDLILDRDVVLVTINYRLGPFGFISTGDAEAPGNYGLLDQSLALRWVRDHISNFGGNGKSVTIMGHSAGGASVEYQVLSPRSKGLFDRAIAQSGSCLSNWAFSKESSIENTKRLAKDLNCDRASSKDVIDCLREKTSSEILAADSKNPSQVLYGFPIGSWLPRVDIERKSPFLPSEPEKMIRGKQFNSVPLITGIAAHEGSLWQKPIVGKKMEEFKQNYVEFIPTMCGFQFRPDKEDLAKKIYQHYFINDKNLKDEIALEQMLSDCNFNKGGEDSTRLFSQYNKENPIFHLMFAHYEPNSPLGASHTSMQNFQFLFSPLTKEKDKIVSKMILDFWTSFASNGIPQSDLLFGKWSPVIDGPKGYLKIENGKAEMVNDSMPFDGRLKYRLNDIFV